MPNNVIVERLAAEYDTLSPQLQRAARYVIDHADDVALLSMRSLAGVAQVHPSTMLRLAREFGYDSYNAFRAPFQEKVRSRPSGYLARAKDLQERGEDNENAQLLNEQLNSGMANLRETMESNGEEQFSAAATVLSEARRIYVVGLRSCFPVAFYFHYVGRLISDNVVLMDGHGGTFADSLRNFGEGDVVFAISFDPYTLEAVQAVEFAKSRGGKIVTLTDSLVSPLARAADEVLIVRNQSPSFFDSIAPALSATETLLELMVARGGGKVLKAIEESEAQLEGFDTYWRKGRKRKPKGP